MSDFETEPVRGLPELLPPGEEILWQGSPDWAAMAIRVFQARKMALWFVFVFAWRFIQALLSGMTLVEAAQAASPAVLFAIVPVGFLVLMGWLTTWVSVYTITTRRIFLRIGIIFSINVNIPFKIISSADVRVFRKGNGDIWLTLMGEERISYAALWPHVRPWRFRPVQPMLRGLPDVQGVAEILGKAIQAALPDAGEEAASTAKQEAGNKAEAPAAAAQ